MLCQYHKETRGGRARTCLAIRHDASIVTLQGAKHNVLDVTEDVSLGVASAFWKAMHLVKCELLAAAILQKAIPCIRPGICLLFARPCDRCMLRVSKVSDVRRTYLRHHLQGVVRKAGNTAGLLGLGKGAHSGSHPAKKLFQAYSHVYTTPCPTALCILDDACQNKPVPWQVQAVPRFLGAGHRSPPQAKTNPTDTVLERDSVCGSKKQGGLRWRTGLWRCCESAHSLVAPS